MDTGKERQLALRTELSRLVSNLTQLGETLEILSERVEEVYLNSNIPAAIHVNALARDLIVKAKARE